MNLWSMSAAGSDLRQHTSHSGIDAQSPSLSNGRVAYQLGADIRLFDINSNQDRAVPVRLVSDFDQLRERWVRNPMDWVATVHLSPTGDRVVLTARGQVFVAPVQQGRMVEATRDKKVRYREGRFFPDGKHLLALATRVAKSSSGACPPTASARARSSPTTRRCCAGTGCPRRTAAHIAHFDKDQQLWIYDVAAKSQKQIAKSDEGGFIDVRWSPDGKWLAYTSPDTNQMMRLHLYNVDSARSTPVTTRSLRQLLTRVQP